MHLDQELLFSSAQAVTATAASTNSIGVSALKKIGNGNPVSMFCHLSTQMTDNSGTDLTFTVALQSDIVDSFDSALKTIWSRTYTYAEVYTAIATTGGFLPGVPDVPPESSDAKFYRAYYTVANGTAGGAAVTCGLCAGKPGNVACVA